MIVPLSVSLSLSLSLVATWVFPIAMGVLVEKSETQPVEQSGAQTQFPGTITISGVPDTADTTLVLDRTKLHLIEKGEYVHIFYHNPSTAVSFECPADTTVCNARYVYAAAFSNPVYNKEAPHETSIVTSPADAHSPLPIDELIVEERSLRLGLDLGADGNPFLMIPVTVNQQVPLPQGFHLYHIITQRHDATGSANMPTQEYQVTVS